MVVNSQRRNVQWWGFAGLVAAVTIGLIWSVWAFAGAILWAVVLAVTFSPTHQSIMRRIGGRQRTAALLTIILILIGLIVPVMLLLGVLANEATYLVASLRANPIDAAGTFEHMVATLPGWARELLQRAGLGDATALTGRIAENAQSLTSAAAGKLVSVGTDVLGLLLSLLVALYLCFVLLTNAQLLLSQCESVMPLEPSKARRLAANFVSVVRATIKGSLLVAFAQGMAGAFFMWLLGVPQAMLWGVVMMFGALLPAVGTGLVWVPASLYLLATGHIWQGIAMALSGLLIIGSIDNVLRPILVGRATQTPDSLVLLTTLGGMAAFGLNGLILGPVIASLFLATWQMVREDNAAIESRGDSRKHNEGQSDAVA
jgi:predicted PurR-regulated permease PerM